MNTSAEILNIVSHYGGEDKPRLKRELTRLVNNVEHETLLKARRIILPLTNVTKFRNQ